MNEDILTIPQAAKYCSLSRVTLWKYVKAGELRASLTPGGQYRLRKKDLESFMRARGMHPFATYQPQNKKVLIVDDDPQIRRLFTNILSHRGYLTETASDGFEVCSWLKNNPDTLYIKILVVTGYDTPENMKRIMDAGADGYLTKPLDSKTLIQNVVTILGFKEEVRYG